MKTVALASAHRGRLRAPAQLTSALRFFVAVLLCLTPLTAVLVLGWLMRLMRREEAAERFRLSRHGDPRRPRLPRWLVADAATRGGRLSYLFGSLVENARLGVATLLTLAAGTLPFTLLLAFSWWAGWENSFNKGYEQAWVGPLVGAVGVAVALPLLARLPMALAHQAAHGRVGAFFERREINTLIRRAGWGYLGLSTLTVLAATPVVLSHLALVLAEDWLPGAADRSAAQTVQFARDYQFWLTAYLLATLIALRRLAARLHARAVLTPPAPGGMSSWLSFALRSVLLWAVWFGLIAQMYVGQFINHDWPSWFNPPLAGLPWVGLF